MSIRSLAFLVLILAQSSAFAGSICPAVGAKLSNNQIVALSTGGVEACISACVLENVYSDGTNCCLSVCTTNCNTWSSALSTCNGGTQSISVPAPSPSMEPF